MKLFAKALERVSGAEEQTSSKTAWSTDLERQRWRGCRSSPLPWPGLGGLWAGGLRWGGGHTTEYSRDKLLPGLLINAWYLDDGTLWFGRGFEGSPGDC